MADQTIDTLAHDNAGAIRKYTRAIVLVAPSTAEPITHITKKGDGDGAISLDIPEAYKPVGLIKKDGGIEFSAERDISDVESLGYAAPTRRDVLKEDSTLKFTPHETNKLVAQLYNGLDLSGIAPDATTGEVSYAKPTTPPAIYYRVLIIGADGVADGAFYKAWFVPRGMITETDSTSMSAEDEAQYPLTLAATPDAQLGYSVNIFEGGAGFKRDAEKLGWAKPAGVGA